MSKTCCIFNLATHYNASIYKKMDESIVCDFYLGDKLYPPIRSMNYDDLIGFKGYLKNIKVLKNFYWQVGSIKLVFKEYTKYIITGEPYCLSTWIILLMCKLLGKQTYLWTHGWYGKETAVRRIIKKIFFGLSSKVLLYGNYAKKLMIKEGFNQNKLIVVYNSINDDENYTYREYLKKSSIYTEKFKNNFPVLIYIGRLQKKKKIELLLEAMKILDNKGKYLNLIIIGKEVEEIGLEKIIKEKKLQNHVWLFGESYSEEILSNLIYNADLCVSPGNVGLTAIHSMIYGTPVVTHNNFKNQMPEFESIIKGETGDFFTEGSATDLAYVIEKWLFNKEYNRDHIRNNCYYSVDSFYNSNIQIKILDSIFKN